MGMSVRSWVEGVSGEALGWIRSRRLWRRYGALRAGAEIQSTGQSLRILFWPFRAVDYTLLVETILADALRLRGHQVAMYFCRRRFDSCENFVVGDYEASVCRRCCRTASLWELRTALPVVSNARAATSGLDGKNPVDRIPVGTMLEHREGGVDLGEIVRASVLRYTLRGEVDVDRDAAVINRYFRTARQVLVDATRVFDTYRPDRLVISHGLYVSWGVATQVAKLRGVPVVVWGTGYREGSLLFVWGGPYHQQLGGESVEEWVEAPLNENERRRLDEYVESKRIGVQDCLAYYREGQVDPGEIAAALRLAPGKPTVGLFPNLLWDATPAYGERDLFRGILDWVIFTIEQMAQQPDCQLIIRAHPAEVRSHHFSRQMVLQEVHQRFPTLPANVRVVPPESPISSYALLGLIDAATVYATKFGLEAVLLGTPVIVCGDAFYRGKGFTHDPESREDYAALLTRPERLRDIPPEVMERARRYAYHYYFRRHQVFDLIRRRRYDANMSGEGLSLAAVSQRLRAPVMPRFGSWRDIASGGRQVVDFICNRIVDGRPFVYEA